MHGYHLTLFPTVLVACLDKDSDIGDGIYWEINGEEWNSRKRDGSLQTLKKFPRRMRRALGSMFLLCMQCQLPDALEIERLCPLPLVR